MNISRDTQTTVASAHNTWPINKGPDVEISFMEGDTRLTLRGTITDPKTLEIQVPDSWQQAFTFSGKGANSERVNAAAEALFKELGG